MVRLAADVFGRMTSPTRFSHICGSPGCLADGAPVAKPVGSAPEAKALDVVEAHVLGYLLA